jgi:hypothetical protein
MSAPSFDNLINMFKNSTKQAADQMGKTAKIAKLKMDIMTLVGEKARHLQAIGQKTYKLYSDTKALNGEMLMERVHEELIQVERIEVRISELENEIKDLQALIQQVEVTDVTNEKQDNHSGESS